MSTWRTLQGHDGGNWYSSTESSHLFSEEKHPGFGPAVMQKIRIRKHSPWAMVGKSSLSIPLPSFCTRCSSLDPHMQPFGCLARTTPPAHQPCSPERHMQHGAGRLSPRPPSWPTEVLHPISPTHPGISLIPDNLSQQSSLPAVEWGTERKSGPFPSCDVSGREKEMLPDSGVVMGNFMALIPYTGAREIRHRWFYSFPLSCHTATDEQFN